MIALSDPVTSQLKSDVIFTKRIIKLVIKWSKSIQARDSIHYLTLPRIKGSFLCPLAACKAALKLCMPSQQKPLFQIKIECFWQPLTESRTRKCLARLNVKTGLCPNHFTFLEFRRSGAPLAYVLLQQIQQHGTWQSDCVWSFMHTERP